MFFLGTRAEPHLCLVPKVGDMDQSSLFFFFQRLEFFFDFLHLLEMERCLGLALPLR